MIHKYLAGMHDQNQLAGDDEALDVARKVADRADSADTALCTTRCRWSCRPSSAGCRRRWPTCTRSPARNGTWPPRSASTTPSSSTRWPREDNLPGLQANVTTPKIIACLRLWEETGNARYRDIARNFWDIATRHHAYVTGGVGNYEHFQQPDTVAAQLSTFTCENCVGYNMLKLTRLLHFHQPGRTDLLDYYERTLLNQMLGEQDPSSPHGFNCYYTGLSAAAFKRQPLNYFPQGNPDVYATDWDTFTCDTATGLETQAKFADTIYSRDAHGLYVNLFVPSQVTLGNLVLRQDTGFPDDPVTRLSVVSGAATVTLRVRVPKWVAGPPVVSLNGAPLQACREQARAAGSRSGGAGRRATCSRSRCRCSWASSRRRTIRRCRR